MNEPTITAAPAVAAETLTVGTVSNMADIIAEVTWRLRKVRDRDRAVDDAQRALTASLSAEQRPLFKAYDDICHDREWAYMDLYIVELGRHLPGLHPVIWSLWRHIIESRHGECCMPDVDGGVS